MAKIKAMMKRRKNKVGTLQAALAPACIVLALCALLLTGGCLPQPPDGAKGGERTITLYGFSVMKESLERAIFPAFAAKWAQEHGERVNFVTSFAGSEVVTNQILAGVGADVAILSIERDVDRLVQGGFVNSDWRSRGERGIVNKTPFVILVRRGNPKGVRDFADLARPGVQLIHPDPASSGGAMWSILAIYGAELLKSERETGGRDEARALQNLQAIWRNVFSTPGSAREARTQFETGYGDALITYELEGLLMKEAGAAVEVVVPQSTIFSEHPAVIVDRNVTPDERRVVEGFVDYLWGEEVQAAFVKHHFRSVNREQLNEARAEFARIEMPFTVELFGGWARAYPEIIEGVWRDKVQKGRKS